MFVVVRDAIGELDDLLVRSCVGEDVNDGDEHLHRGLQLGEYIDGLLVFARLLEGFGEREADGVAAEVLMRCDAAGDRDVDRDRGEKPSREPVLGGLAIG